MASRREIARITDRLLHQFGETFRQEYERLRTSFPIADVEFNIERLNSLIYVWMRFFGDGYPCAVDNDGPIPLFSDIEPLFYPSAAAIGQRFWPPDFPGAYYLLREDAERFYGQKEVKILDSSTEKRGQPELSDFSRSETETSRHDPTPVVA